MSSRLASVLFLIFGSLVSVRGAEEVVVATYNLENYVSASTRVPGEKAPARAKSDKEIEAAAAAS